MATCGQQTSRTKGAFVTAGRGDRDKFVFCGAPSSDFDCGDLLRGRFDSYQLPPSLEERRRSGRQYGYRLRTDENGLQISYSNVEFTFWYQEQERLELDVYDDLFLYYPDNLIAHGALNLKEAFRLAFAEDGTTLSDRPRVLLHVALAPSIVSLRPSGMPASSDGDGGTGSSTSSRIAGEMEIEIEFLEEAVACVTPLEKTFREAVGKAKEAKEEHRKGLEYLAEIMASSVTSSGLPALEDLFHEQRDAWAIAY